jgi:hypothetical protein
MATSEARANRKLAHRTELPMALGCLPCPEHLLCGGLKTDEILFDCGDLCRCSEDERKMCPHVCRSKPQEYVRRRQEVDSFDLGTIGNVHAVPEPDLPAVIPWIDGRSCLAGGLDLPMVAVPLRRLFSRRTGRAVPDDKAALAARFAVAPTTAFLVTGVSYEQPIEDYWSPTRSAGFLDDLAALAPAMVTTPNFSLFSNKPREDNLYNMKRIAICWHELASRGIPTALHLNARTDHDWRRWRQFLVTHPEIGAVAFEFATGAAPKARARWYLQQLIAIAGGVDRHLRLVVRGGRSLLPELRAHFSQVSFIAPDPLIKARKRRALVPGFDSRQPFWGKVVYKRGEKVDQLFLRNLAEYSRLVV